MVKYRYVWGKAYPIHEPVSAAPAEPAGVSAPTPEARYQVRGKYYTEAEIKAFPPQPSPTEKALGLAVPQPGERYIEKEYVPTTGKPEIIRIAEPMWTPGMREAVVRGEPIIGTRHYEAPVVPVVTTTRRPAVPTYVPEDIGAPMTRFGQRTIAAKEMEEAAATWREPMTFKEPGALEQFAISAAVWPAETGVGLVSFGISAVARPGELPSMIKTGVRETIKGLKAGRPSVYGSMAGGLLWTVALPKVFGKYRQWQTGLAPGESIYQPRWEKPDIAGIGRLDMETGKIPFVSKARIGEREMIGIGVSKELEELVPGARISMMRVAGEAPEYFGLGYDITIPTGEKMTIGAGVFEIKQIKGMVPRPTARFYGGYGVVPATEVTFETTYMTTKSLAKMFGEPKVVAEWQIAGATWRDPTVEMMRLRTMYDVRGISISPTGFLPYIGKAAFELTAPVIPTGGAGGLFVTTPRIPGFLGGMGTVFGMPEWTKAARIGVAPTAIAAGRMAEAAVFAPPVVTMRETYLAGLEHEGYIARRREPALGRMEDVGTDVGRASETVMRTAMKQASKVGLKQETRFETIQELGIGQEMGLGLKRAQKQAQKVGLGLRFMIAPMPIVPIVPRAFVPIPPIVTAGFPRMEVPRWGKPRRPRKRRKIPVRRRFRYTPTILGMERARGYGITLPRAPKFVGVQAVGIRPPVAKKRKKPRKRTDKKRKRRYQRNFARSLGL